MEEEFFKTSESEPMPCMNDGCQDCKEDNCFYRKESFDWGDPVSVYTRADAIADGALIDMSEIAKKYGIKYHTVMTNGLVAEVNEKNIENVIYGLRIAILGRRENGNRIDFNYGNIDVYALIHGGDHGEPVITIMLKGED